MPPTLPPLANLIAMRSRDPGRRARFAQRVESDSTLKTFRPAPDWIAAFHTLPLSIPDPDEVLCAGFVFAEGREAVLQHGRSCCSPSPCGRGQGEVVE